MKEYLVIEMPLAKDGIGICSVDVYAKNHWTNKKLSAPGSIYECISDKKDLLRAKQKHN